MKTICFVLALMVLSTTTPAYADSILWASEHESTDLFKDERWIEEASSTITSVEGIEGTTDDASVEHIDAMGVEEEDSTASPTDLDIISGTVDDEPAPVEPVADEVESMVTTLDLIEDTGEETDIDDYIDTETDSELPVSDITSTDVEAEQMNTPVIIEGEAETQ